MKARDTQRSKVYRAEHALEKVLDGTRKHYNEFSLQETEEFIMSIRCNPSLRRRYERQLARTITIHDGRGHRWAWGGADRVVLPRWARNPIVICHEVAHVIQRRISYRTAAHGWEFCAIYLDIVRFVLGKKAYEALRDSFKENRVRFKAKRTRVMSEETKALLRSRMIGLRQLAAEKRSKEVGE